MRILYLTTHLNRGGVVSYIYSLAINLKKIGHDIIVASCGGDMQKILTENGAECIYIPIRTKNEISPRILFSYLKLKKYILKNPPDLIHAHTRVSQVLGFFLSKRFNVPLVTTCHGFFRPRWHRRKFSCWGDKVIAISSQVKNHLMSDFKVKESDICLVHHGIDLIKFRNRTAEEINLLKSEIGITQNYFVIGSSGRFSDVKGLEYLIKAANFVLPKKEKVIFLLVGYGKDELRLKKIVKDSNLENRVIFYRPIKEIQEYLCVMDIFVMPSIQEGLGLSILEAQAQKIPVVASKIGGIPDIILDNITGILVEPRDAVGISNAILRLMDDLELCEKIKHNAYQRLTQEFSLSKMIDETENVYKSAIAQNKI